MKQTPYNNKYYTTILNKVIQKSMKKEQEYKKEKLPKRAKFTYMRKLTKFTKKLF
jgi:hypothetical protein